MEVKVNFKGLNELRANFKDSPRIVRKRIALGIEEGAAHIEREVKLLTPVDTGRLRSSFGAQGQDGIKELRAEFARLGTNVEYAAEVHRLNVPYAQAGAKRAQPKVDRAFKKAIDGIASDLTK